MIISKNLRFFSFLEIQTTKLSGMVSPNNRNHLAKTFFHGFPWCLLTRFLMDFLLGNLCPFTKWPLLGIDSMFLKLMKPCFEIGIYSMEWKLAPFFWWDRYHIITQLAIYTTSIPGIYCQLGDYIWYLSPIKGTRNSY